MFLEVTASVTEPAPVKEEVKKDWKFDYSIWISAETEEEADEQGRALMSKLFSEKRISDYDGPL